MGAKAAKPSKAQGAQGSGAAGTVEAGNGEKAGPSSGAEVCATTPRLTPRHPSGPCAARWRTQPWEGGNAARADRGAIHPLLPTDGQSRCGVATDRACCTGVEKFTFG